MKRRPPGDYVVGYGRPPAAHRWKPGQSGNPRGGRKKPETVAAALWAKLQARIVVGEAGRHRSMTMQELILETLVRDAARSDLRARALLFGLMARYEGTDEAVVDPTSLSSADQNLIDAYLARAAQDEAGAQPPSGGRRPRYARRRSVVVS